MDHSGILLGETKPFEGPASAERDQLSISTRKFTFDPDTLRGNHLWVTVTATDESSYTSLFVIALDPKNDDSDGNDYQAFQYRAHGTPGQTEVIVGLLPSAPMRALVKALLDPENPGITLGISTCS